MHRQIVHDIIIVQILLWHVHISVILDIHIHDDIGWVDVIFHEHVYEYVHEAYQLMR